MIGIVGILLGIFTFLIRCFCPPPRSSRTNRSQVHRHRGQRVPTTNNRGGERRPSQQRVWSTLPPLAASTPIDPSINRSLERTLSNAPPTYDEAMGR